MFWFIYQIYFQIYFIKYNLGWEIRNISFLMNSRAPRIVCIACSCALLVKRKEKLYFRGVFVWWCPLLTNQLWKGIREIWCKYYARSELKCTEISKTSNYSDRLRIYLDKHFVQFKVEDSLYLQFDNYTQWNTEPDRDLRVFVDIT